MMVFSGSLTSADVYCSKTTIEKRPHRTREDVFFPIIPFQLFRSPAIKWLSCRHCSADSEIAIDRADDRFYTTGPNLLLLSGAYPVLTGRIRPRPNGGAG